jgi:hypothetical protein
MIKYFGTDNLRVIVASRNSERIHPDFGQQMRKAFVAS